MSDKQTFFNPEWEDPYLNPQWSPWLKSVQGFPNVARCTYCQKVIQLSNMGRQAITSHATSSKRHQKLVENKNNADKFKSFFTKDDSTESSSSLSSQKSNVTSLVTKDKPQKLDIKSFVTKDDVLSAEILWAMKLVFSHISFNSFNDAAIILQKMFDDSHKAKSVTLGRSKMAYLVSYGLAPYFKNQLISIVRGTEYVICFDEALNKIIQRGQMDLLVRFWDNKKAEVTTRYLSSVFLGHSTANDLLKGFFEGISELDKKKLLQVSLDGPNVNLKFLKDLKEYFINEDGCCNLVDIGSCGLHVVHGAFRTGHKATGWHLNDLFKDIHRLFKNSPARRADYIAITDTTTFPLKFCEVRWCENVPVAERAVQVFPHLKKYIESTTLPHTVTVDRLNEAVKDKLILAKISFFISIANVLYPFLKSFQSADPKCPFLYSTFYSMLHQLMSKFIKTQILREATPLKLMMIDVTDQKNRCNFDVVDIGIAAGAHLAKSGASDKLKKEFRIDCRTFLIKVTQKILERSPFKYNFVKYLSSLDPHLIVSNELIAEKRMEKLLCTLYESNWINSIIADKAKMQFKEVLLRCKGMWKDNFMMYSDSSMRLDHFYRDLLDNSDFSELWKSIKIVMILSHGNATVESGFSVNKDMLVDNLHESSLVAMRVVYDAIKSSGGVMNINITPDMLRYARGARNTYHQALEEKKMCESKEKEKISAKRKANAQIKILEAKKQKINKSISLEMSAIESQIADLKKQL